MIVSLLGGRQETQEELTEAQLSALGERLIKGEVNSAQATILLLQQVGRGDAQAVGTTLEYLAALGMDGPTVLKIAAEFYLDRRHYAEAQRYAQTLCYEHDRYGSALRTLAILDTLQGDYVTALLHIDEYFERSKEDAVLRLFQLSALLRAGAVGAARELNRQFGMRPHLEAFLIEREQGRGFGRFSWHGTPTRSGEILEGVDLNQMRRFMSNALKNPLGIPVADMPELDRRINAGTYVSDSRRYGHPDVWVQPASFERTLVGDCEDFALWAWTNLCRLGYPARFVAGGWYSEAPNHAWVTIHRGRTVQLLECTPQGFNPVVRASEAIEYRPWWSVDRNLHFYRH